MIEAAEQALANFQHEQAMAATHQRRADGYLAQFLSLVGQKAGNGPTGQAIRCVREWTRWLSENGPALKPDIQEATGIKFTERGTPHTFLWDESMDPEDDDAYPASAIMRVQGPPQDGRGRPPMVYFLWSQRWDVHPLFGVGPRRAIHSMEPREVEATVDGEPTTLTRVPLRDEWPDEQSAMTGVVRPPSDGWTQPVPSVTPMVEGEEQTFDWSEPDSDQATWAAQDAAADEPDRFLTMEGWDAAWAEVFDGLVATESKPSELTKAEMAATLPLGADTNAALAIAYRAAVERSRQ